MMSVDGVSDAFVYLLGLTLQQYSAVISRFSRTALIKCLQREREVSIGVQPHNVSFQTWEMGFYGNHFPDNTLNVQSEGIKWK